MRNAHKVLALFFGVTALSACNKNQERNVAINNDVANATDVEALPPDESSETPSNELINGADNADVSDHNASGNGY
jgi:hypothetical protein